MNDTLVKTEHLSKKFKADFVLKDINLTLDAGKFYALIGKKSAGKSTLLRLISGLAKPSSGAVIVNAVNPSYIIGCPALIEEMSVIDNMKARCMLTGTPFSDIYAILGYLQLPEKADPKKLSKYDKYALGIALALLSKPDFLALDEPFAGLTAEEIKKMTNVIGLSREKTKNLIVTSDNLSDYASIANEFIILHDGQIIGNLTRADLSKNVRKAVCISVSDPDAALRILDVKLGIKNADVEDGYLIIYDQTAERGDIYSVLSENAVRIYQTKHFHATYEEYFESLIGGESS
jgi:ABC-2 type transport system ATP-binding protein